MTAGDIEPRTLWDYYRALASMIKSGASLEDLYHVMLRVTDADPTDVSPERLRWLATSTSPWPEMAVVRLNELFGGLKIEHNDEYVLALIGALGGWHPEIREHMLRHDKELRETLFWRIFEVEGGGEVSLANVDKFSKCSPENNWKNTVIRLAAGGVIDRARVLRSCLQALNRDFSAYRAGWFSQTFTELAPTPAESARDQDLLLRLIGSTITATMSLAVKRLAAIQKAGLLDSTGFVAVCGTPLAGPKGAAETVLRMLGALPDDVSGVCEAAVTALAHPHPDVQRTAVRLLLARKRDDLLRTNRDVLTPAVAAEFRQELGETTAPKPTTTLDAEPEASTVMPVVPWDDNEVVDQIAALLEGGSDPIAFEQALAWLARAQSPAAVLQPLVKRAAKQKQSEARYIAVLILAAADPASEFLPQQYYSSKTSSLYDGDPGPGFGEVWAQPTAEAQSALPLLVRRLREVAAIVQGRSQKRPLLATPTDRCGWIEPGVLVDRFLQTDAAGAGPLLYDFIQALLRLEKQGRPMALAQLTATAISDTNAEAAAVLHYALGGDGSDIHTRAWWAAASVARGNEADINPRLYEAGLIESGLGLPPTAEVSWESRSNIHETRKGPKTSTWWYPTILASGVEEPSPDYPLLLPSEHPLVSGHRYTLLSRQAVTIHQLALVYPASTLPLAATAFGLLNAAVKSNTSDGEEHVLTALAAHQGTWTSVTSQLLALGLSADRAEVRAQSAELLLQAVPTRVSPEMFAAAMAECHEACKLTRWAAALKDAAGISARGSRIVVDVLSHLLPRLDRGAQGVGTLLGLLLDETIRSELPIDAALRTWLGGFTGASGTAKTAKALLARAIA